FVRQVAGLTQITGDLMNVRPAVIDLGWGALKSALLALPDSEFVTPTAAAGQRKTLLDQYVAAFRTVERAATADAKQALAHLTASITTWIGPVKRTALHELVDAQIGKL